jgi:hypothetical protein
VLHRGDESQLEQGILAIKVLMVEELLLLMHLLEVRLAAVSLLIHY